MTTFRRLLSLAMALCLMMSFGLTALAAEYTASDYAGLVHAFSGADNAEGDTAVNVTINNNIDFGGNSLTTRNDFTYTISGDNSSAGQTLVNAAFDGSGSVVVNTDIVGDNGKAALTTSGEV